MVKINRITLQNLEGVLVPKHELKFIVGGCTIDGGDLPEFEVVCDADPGKCWACDYDNPNHQCAYFTGVQSDDCNLPWRC